MTHRNHHRFRRRHRIVVGVGAAVLAGCGSSGGGEIHYWVEPTDVATTTTVPPETTTNELPPNSVARSTLPAPVVGSTGRCGGDLPPCWVMGVESRGDPAAVNPTGCGGRGCYGKWQFDPLTSQGLGYPLTMDQYPEHVQDDAARTLWNHGDGCSHWAACS